MATPSYAEYEAAFLRLNPGVNQRVVMDRYMRRYGPQQATAPGGGEEPGLFGSMWSGALAGTLGIGESTGTALRYLGGRVDSPALTETGRDVEQYFAEAAAPYAMPASLRGSIYKNPRLLADPRWWLYTTANVAPTLFASLLPGGAAMHGARLLGAGAKAAGLVGAGVGGLAGGSLEGAQTYRTALERGMSEEEAARKAEQMTVASAILNALSTGKLLQPTTGWGQRALKGLTEAATEYAEEPAEALILGEPLGERMRAGLNVIPPSFLSGGLLAGTGAMSPQAQPAPQTAPQAAPTTPRQMGLRLEDFALTPTPAAPETPAAQMPPPLAPAGQMQMRLGEFELKPPPGTVAGKPAGPYELHEQPSAQEFAAFTYVSPLAFNSQDYALPISDETKPLSPAISEAIAPKLLSGHPTHYRSIETEGGPPIFLYPLNESAGQVTRAFQDLASAGFPLELSLAGIKQIAQHEKRDRSAPAFYDPETGTVSIRADRLQTLMDHPQYAPGQREMRMMMTHELTHAMDISMRNYSNAWTSEYFAINTKKFHTSPLKENGTVDISWDPGSMGPVMEEVVTMMDKAVRSGDLNEVVTSLWYPMQWLPTLGDTDVPVNIRRATAKRIQAELFAQLNMMFYNYPNVLKQALPKSYAAMQEAHNALSQNVPGADRLDALRKALRASGASARGARTVPGRIAATGESGAGVGPAGQGMGTVPAERARGGGLAGPALPGGDVVRTQDRAIRQQRPGGETQGPYESFASFNEEERPLTLDEAQAMVRHPQQAAIRTTVQKLADSLGIKAKVFDAVGDTLEWGSEPSLYVEFDTPDFDAAQYIMARVGRAFKQKGVVPFVYDRQGADAIYKIWTRETDLTKLAGILEQNGLQYRTFRPTPAGTEIIIFDQGRTLSERVHQTASQALRADVRVRPGRGEILARDTREEARALFDDVIRDFEAVSPVSARSRVAQRSEFPAGPWYTLTPPKPPKGGFRISRTAIEERAAADAARVNAEDFAQSINLAKWDTAADVKATVREVAKRYEPLFVGTRRGVQPIAEIEAAAEALAANPKELVKRIPGENLAAQLHALRRISITLAEQYRAAAEKADATGSDADLAAAAQAESRFALFASTYTGGATESGRAQRMLREHAKGAQNLAGVLEQLGGVTDIRARMRMAKHLLQPGQLATFAKESWATKAKHALIELWMNMLLSGPQTHAVNLSSNGLFNIIGDVERYIAAGIGRLHGGERVTFREANAYTFGTIQGIKEGLRAMRAAWAGEPMDIAGRLDMKRAGAFGAEVFGARPETLTGRILNRAGEVIRTPSRLLGTADDFFKSLEVRKELNALAVRDAFANKLTGEAAAQHIQAFLATPPGWALDKAYAAGQYMTFTKQAGPIAGALIHASNEQPLLKLIVPFVRTPTNIVKAAVERSPFGLLMREVRDNLRQKGPTRDIALARMAFGTGVGAWVMAQTAQGLLTGGGPPDKEARNAWYATGWQPYSFKIGDKYYAFNRLEPIGMLMGVASDFAEIGNYATDKEKTGIAAMITGSVMKNLLSKTWLRGISELVSALEDPDRYGKQWLLNYAGTLVPTGLAQAARAQDPYLREARTLIDKIKSRLPYKSQTLYPKRDLFGRPIALEGGVGPDVVSPIYQSSYRHDPAADELVRLDYYPQMPRRSLHGVELPAPLYDEYVQLTGKPLHAALTRIVTSPGYTRLPRPYQRELLEDTVTKIKRAATEVFYARHPEIRRAQLMQLAQEVRQ